MRLAGGSPGNLLRRAVAPALIVLMVLVIGFVGYNAIRAADGRSEEVHLQDRLVLQSTLSDMSSQYLSLAIAEASDFGNSQPWSFRPRDPADTRRLSSFVASSRLLSYGAALLGITGTPINEASHDGGLPPSTDPGYQPMIASLVARHPGVSSVMMSKGHPVVALAVPIIRSGQPAAIFVAAFRADQGALQGYAQKLKLGNTGMIFVLDSRGGVVAASNPKLIGTRLTDAASGEVRAGHRGVRQFGDGSGRIVASFVPISVGGWGGLTEQKSDEFFATIRTSRANLRLILVGLLAIAAIGLGLLNFKRQQALRDAALFDPLTGLYNRRALYTLGEYELKRATRSGTPAAVMLADLDDLKRINDTHGHAAGDAAICEAARVLTAVCRSTDIISRVGGDEFCVLVTGMDPALLVGRVRDEVERVQAAAGRAYDLGLALGVARFDPTHPQSIQDLMAEADASMYRDKRSGHQQAVEAIPADSAVR